MKKVYYLLIILFSTQVLFGQTVYLPNDSSLGKHPLPEWYSDAKFGIFIHWGLYSVPGYAPIIDESRPESLAFILNPYAEWYCNTMLVDSSPTRAYHLKTYGKDFGYYDFINIFNKEIVKWDPDEWASLFEQAGAKYAVLTSKHCDGFTLWKSKVQNPNFSSTQPTVSRDIVADFSSALARKDIKMGLYYSGGFDWSFIKPPLTNRQDWDKFKPQTKEYAAYADAQWLELINNYKPSILWNDIDYPKLGKTAEIISNYYNEMPNGVVNNRFGTSYYDFTTPEYAINDSITHKKWETCRGLGGSFGYNQLDDEKSMLSVDQLVDLLIDIVSKNGNLLLNIGPKADGTVPEGQKQRLIGMGKWLKVNGECIYGTRPYTKFKEKAKDGTDIRFTCKNNTVYIILLQRPKSSTVVLPGIPVLTKAKITLIGCNADLKWKQDDKNLSIDLPDKYNDSEAYVIKINK